MGKPVLDLKAINPNTGKAHITSKMDLWLRHYTNEANKLTFLNKTESAKAAGYKCNNVDSFGQIGAQNFRKLSDKISVWFDEIGLSENALKAKLQSLMEVKEKKFFSAPIKDADGIVVGMHIESEEVEAIETQRKSLDMALKVRGMMKPIEHAVKGSVGMEHSLDGSWKDLLTSVTTANSDKLPNKLLK